MIAISAIQFALSVGCALILGASIGLERQWRQRTAGLRTNALVSTGASLFVLLAQAVAHGGDPSKIASGVVTGIGFLGAGVIMKDGSSIRGLNTAATLWCSAAIGCLCGFGFYTFGLMAAFAVVGIHIALRPMAERINRQPQALVEQDFKYQMLVECERRDKVKIRTLVLQLLSPSCLILHCLRSEDQTGSSGIRVQAEVESHVNADAALEQIASRLSLEKNVTAVSWGRLGAQS